jgi:glutathione peroxidase
MFYKNYLLILISLIMFTFLEKAEAKYEKLFYDLSINNIDNNIIDLSKFRGKTVLLVNVASNCGFTKQYSSLQKLYDQYKDKNFIILGVPSNQFGGQEPGSNNEIKNFCKINFNITFPITDKVDVKGDDAHLLYKWAKENHGKSTVPKWNFHKILINKDGKIHDTFNSFIDPLSEKIKKQLELIL